MRRGLKALGRGPAAQSVSEIRCETPQGFVTERLDHGFRHPEHSLLRVLVRAPPGSAAGVDACTQNLVTLEVTARFSRPKRSLQLGARRER